MAQPRELPPRFLRGAAGIVCDLLHGRQALGLVRGQRRTSADGQGGRGPPYRAARTIRSTAPPPDRGTGYLLRLSCLAETVFTEQKMRYVVQLLSPMAFLALGSPLVLISLPVFAFNLLTTFHYQYQLEYHYHAPLIPVLWAATVLALGRIGRPQLRLFGVTLLLLSTLLSAY